MRPLRAAFVAAGIANLVLALGYVTRQQWATATWPWPGDSPLTYAFVGAIIAAIGAAAVWMGAADEFGSVPAGALNLTITMGGAAAYLAQVADEPGRGGVRPYALGAGTLALGNLALFLATAMRPRPDRRPVPKRVLVAFITFTAILLVVGLALLLGADRVMPWRVRPDSAVLIGWIFLGDAFYFAYAVLRPSGDGYRAQLWSFLAYDLVLLPPLLSRALSLPADLQTNLVVYVSVLLGSAALAVAVLAVDPLRGRHLAGGRSCQLR